MKIFYKTLVTQGKDINWLAKKLKVSRQAVSRWKLGIGRPTPKHLVKMAEILDIDVATLFKDFL